MCWKDRNEKKKTSESQRYPCCVTVTVALVLLLAYKASKTNSDLVQTTFASCRFLTG